MHLQTAILFAQKIGKLIALTAWNLLNSISQWRHNIKILKTSAPISNNALSIHIHLKSPKSLDIVPLGNFEDNNATDSVKCTYCNSLGFPVDQSCNSHDCCYQ